VLVGLGNLLFTRSGAAAASGTLEGKAILAPGSLHLSRVAASFGAVALNSASKTITVTLTNPNAIAEAFTYSAQSSSPFAVNNQCASPLAAGASCELYINLQTGAAGAFSRSFSITPASGSAMAVAMNGTVVDPSTAVSLSTVQHNFGSVSDGSNAGYVLSITNTSATNASLSFSNSSGAGFSATSNCSTPADLYGTSLAPGAVCNYNFTFAPTSVGSSTDALVITSNLPLLPGGVSNGFSYVDTVTLTGTGIVGGELTASSVGHNFGTLAQGTSGGNFGIELSNNTSAMVTLGFAGLTNSADGFSVVGTNCESTLGVNANCEIIFTFDPAAQGLGTVSAVYPITASVPLYSGGVIVSPAEITLTATGE
jgi:hypothetical protein